MGRALRARSRRQAARASARSSVPSRCPLRRASSSCATEQCRTSSGATRSTSRAMCVASDWQDARLGCMFTIYHGHVGIHNPVVGCVHSFLSGPAFVIVTTACFQLSFVQCHKYFPPLNKLHGAWPRRTGAFLIRIMPMPVQCMCQVSVIKMSCIIVVPSWPPDNVLALQSLQNVSKLWSWTKTSVE